MDCETQLVKDDGPLYQDVAGYKRLIGRLLYLTTTIPDISFTMQQFSQFLYCPTQTHVQAAHNVLLHLKGKPGSGFFFPRASPLQLKGFSHANCGVCPDFRRVPL